MCFFNIFIWSHFCVCVCMESKSLSYMYSILSVFLGFFLKFLFFYFLLVLDVNNYKYYNNSKKYVLLSLLHPQNYNMLNLLPFLTGTFYLL